MSEKSSAEKIEGVRSVALCVVATAALVACSPATEEASLKDASVDQASTQEAAPESSTVADQAAPPQEPVFTPRPLEVGVPFTTEDGLKIIAHKLGDGSLAIKSRPVTVHYTGWVFDESAADNKGKKFDSSVDRGTPFRFTLGAGKVIRGWDEGVLGMKVGGSRTLIIPPDMAYGARGVPRAGIPGSSTLVFDVEMLGVE